MRALAWLSLVACTTPRPVDVTIDPDAHFPPPTPCTPGAQAMYDGGAYTRLADALADATVPRSVVTICSGVYSGGFRMSGPGPLWLAGETGNPNDVVLDGGQAEGVLWADDPAAVLRVTGLTIRNGLADPRTNGQYFAGLGLNGDEGQLIVQGCAFTGNTSRTDTAPALDTYATNVLVEHSSFTDNTGTLTGAASVVHYVRGARVVFRDTTFRGNHGGLVGALGIQGGTNQPPPGKDLYALERIRVIDNDGGSVGGIQLKPNHPVDMRLEDSELSRNVSSGYAGALSVYRMIGDRNQRITILRSQIVDNESSGAAIDLAGGFHDPFASMLIGQSSVLRNRSTTPGAISVGAEWGLAMMDVDMGAGADDNTGDVAGCAAALGAGTRGQVVPAQGDLCP